MVEPGTSVEAVDSQLEPDGGENEDQGQEDKNMSWAGFGCMCMPEDMLQWESEYCCYLGRWKGKVGFATFRL